MPFLHVTTRIDGHPHDGLLREKGFGGFPSLAFMDAEGEVLGQPQDRSVASFRATLDALSQIEEVTARVEAGDEAAKVDLLLLEHALGRVSGEAFAARVAELADVATPEQKAKLDAIATDEAAWELVLQAFQGDREDAMAKLLGMLDDGRLPSAGSRPESYFWSMLAEHAQGQGDTAMLRRISKALYETGPTDESLLDMIRSMNETADALVERDALAERSAKGEAGLEAKILLIELRLDAVTYESFEGRLDAALAVATEEEAAELRQGGVDLEASDLVDRFWGGGDQAAIGERAMAMLLVDGLRPSAEVLGIMSNVVYNWAWRTLEPDDIAAQADALAEAWGEDEAVTRMVDQLRKMADDKRERE